VVTEGLTLEKKNKDAIKIPFSKSPKIAITTNYAIKGAGNSFARRRLFFGDWNDDEWCVFDNYMIQCLQLYLREGLMQSEFVNLKIRQLSAETSHDFVEWCGLLDDNIQNTKLDFDIKIYMNELYFDFVNEYPDYAPKSKMTISRQRFYKWLHAYCVYRTGVKPFEGKDMNGKWIEIKRDETQPSKHEDLF